MVIRKLILVGCALVIDNPQPGFGVVGRDWMWAAGQGDSGLIHTPGRLYYGRLVNVEGTAAHIELAPNFAHAKEMKQAVSDVANIPAQDLRIGGDAPKRYFLIGPRPKDKEPQAGFGLIVILPGGSGSAEFHTFVKRILKYAVPEGYLVAQPVAVKWADDQAIVWPTEKNRVAEMKFTTEAFVDAVIADAGAKHKLNPQRIFTLSWSSGGPAAYATSLTSKKVVGSFIAMSVFNPEFLPPLANAKGQAYYLFHSPEDGVCPNRMAKQAVQKLEEQEGKVKLTDYAGGHGWKAGMYDHMRTGIEWLEKNAAARKAE